MAAEDSFYRASARLVLVSLVVARRTRSGITCAGGHSLATAPRLGAIAVAGLVRLTFWAARGVVCVGQPCACRGLPARARWASPSASSCVGCAWIRPATSSGNASQLVISWASPTSSLTRAPIM